MTGFFRFSKHCTRTPRCVKCAKNHLAKDCPKPIDEKPKCCLCEGEHPANFLGCPKNPRHRIAEGKEKKKNEKKNPPMSYLSHQKLIVGSSELKLPHSANSLPQLASRNPQIPLQLQLPHRSKTIARISIQIFSTTSRTQPFTRIMDHCDRNHIIPDFPHGFRKETSTQHQLLRVTNNIIHGFNTKTYTVGIFLDVKKAFDRMCHDGLIYKMIQFKFPTYLVKIIHHYLNNTTFNVKINSTSSSDRSIASGTPQGSILSPAIYNIYTGDFPTNPSVSVCLFADAAAILCNSITVDQAVRTTQATQLSQH
ncbi:RNA-directed DNA polymerase from mobile element jockey [Trichonephila clavipes]|nr:RNA-directed DNA polymerase from mobile element jockey [Trichonephila clavipes]